MEREGLCITSFLCCWEHDIIHGTMEDQVVRSWDRVGLGHPMGGLALRIQNPRAPLAQRRCHLGPTCMWNAGRDTSQVLRFGLVDEERGAGESARRTDRSLRVARLATDRRWAAPRSVRGLGRLRREWRHPAFFDCWKRAGKWSLFWITGNERGKSCRSNSVVVTL